MIETLVPLEIDARWVKQRSLTKLPFLQVLKCTGYPNDSSPQFHPQPQVTITGNLNIFTGSPQCVEFLKQWDRPQPFPHWRSCRTSTLVVNCLEEGLKHTLNSFQNRKSIGSTFFKAGEGVEEDLHEGVQHRLPGCFGCPQGRESVSERLNRKPAHGRCRRLW